MGSRASGFVGLGQYCIWEFPKIRGTLFGVPIIRILLFRVLYQGPLFSETPICIASKVIYDILIYYNDEYTRDILHEIRHLYSSAEGVKAFRRSI